MQILLDNIRICTVMKLDYVNDLLYKISILNIISLPSSFDALENKNAPKSEKLQLFTLVLPSREIYFVS